MNEQHLLETIKKAEGCRLRSYTDTLGVWTCGYGRNLQTMTISQSTAETWLAEDVYMAYQQAKTFQEWQFLLDCEARQNAFVEMVYNLGMGGVKGFPHMLLAMHARDWNEVAKQCLDSKWHSQVGERAQRIAEMFRTGEFQE